MAYRTTTANQRACVRRRWRKTTALARHRWGMWLRRRKGALHAHRVQALNGHFAFMTLCSRYARQLARKLTPADHAYIRSRHAEEIAASAKPLDESKRLRRKQQS